MKIEEYIGFGKANAVTRRQLCAVTGFSDRDIRDEIANARGIRGAVILNDQDGHGYYIPTIEEYTNAVKCLKSEEKRAKSVFWTLKALRKWVADNAREPGTQ